MDTYGLEASKKASWLSMNAKVKQTRILIHQYGTKVPSNFTAYSQLGFSSSSSSNTYKSVLNGENTRPPDRQMSDGQQIQLLFLCAMEPGTESTLFTSPLPNLEDDKEYHGTLPWNKLIDSTGFPQQTSNTSKEEILMSERKRCSFWGINSYEFDDDSGTVIFPANGSLFQTSVNGSVGFKEISSQFSSLNATMCPSDPSLIAYYAQYNMWIFDANTNFQTKLTDLSEADKASGHSAGLPSYIMQEEFNRYTGFWWCPVADSDESQYILFERVDESQVQEVKITSHEGVSEDHRFPKTGETNATSDLKLIKLDRDTLSPTVFDLNFDLHEYFPWYEYLVRAGWTPDGKRIWACLVDRYQRRLEIVLIDRSAFSPSFGLSPYLQVIFREDSDSWINVSDILYFFDQNSPNSIEFIVSSEETGYRHLYYVLASFNPQIAASEEEAFRRIQLQPQILKKVPITSGEWSVAFQQVTVDPDARLVFFHGYKDTPIEKHGYVVSLDRPCHVRRLTEANYSHNCDFFVDHHVMVSVFSNTKTEPACLISKLKFNNDNNVDNIQFQRLGWLLPQRDECDMCFPLPDIMHREISSGQTLYSIMYHPPNLDVRRKYPVILNIYGGPDFQLVTNTFKGAKYVRNYLLSSLGYVVISIDSRGSSNRGKAFESHIYKRLGQVELKDQLEVLNLLASDMAFLDMTRVAINGWSYGGYLALRGLVDHPDFFKLAIAGAPVTDWRLYDTAYTERYMDLPANNPSGYALGSILEIAFRFPDDRDRLLVAHGKLDENVHFQHTERLLASLSRHCKPIHLQVYPTERHSLRHMDVSEHFETTLICFLSDHL